MNIQDKYENLKRILERMENVLVAFSGGVDSTFLLKVARDSLGDDVLAVIASSEIFKEEEKQEALKLAQELNVRHRIIRTRELENPNFVKNSPQRCYYCKKGLFSRLKEIATAEGISNILDGANFEDTADFRPGARAARELGVYSPLRDVKLSKKEIRTLSKDLNLPTWDKPSSTCLSTRFPYNMEINEKRLKQVTRAEEYLKTLGFSQIRVRHHGKIARIEFSTEEISTAVNPSVREEIASNLKKIGYTYITLDLSGYRSGSMNEVLPESVKISGRTKSID